MKCCLPGCVFPVYVGPYCRQHLLMRADPVPFLNNHATELPDSFEPEVDRNRRRSREYERRKGRPEKIKQWDVRKMRFGLDALTAKEFSFAQLLSQGLPIGIVAVKMGWTIDTARSYRSKLYFKAGMGLEAIRREIAGGHPRAA